MRRLYSNLRIIGLLVLIFPLMSIASPRTGKNIINTPLKSSKPRDLKSFETSPLQIAKRTSSTLLFDFPVTYNSQVRHWIKYFQTTGRKWFKRWIERSYRYLPAIQLVLQEEQLPLDLAYVAMIESGFSHQAVSTAKAVGPWQFIQATGKRYGLKTYWWLDERRDFDKSTRAAARYISDLYQMFGSWYLVVASYNMGENGVKRLIRRYQSRNYWTLVQKGAFSDETKNYVPKLIAAMLISKAPGLYGFRKLKIQTPTSFDYFFVPGGTDLVGLADYLGITRNYLLNLNPELLKGFVPRHVKNHKIRVPKRSIRHVSKYVRARLKGRHKTGQSSTPLL